MTIDHKFSTARSEYCSSVTAEEIDFLTSNVPVLSICVLFSYKLTMYRNTKRTYLMELRWVIMGFYDRAKSDF